MLPPGCDQPAARCDIDHGGPPWGPTCACNLSPRCRRHHNAKTHHRWQVRARLDGRHVTVSPTGRVYPTAIHPPPGPLPERVPDPPDEDDEAGDSWAGDDALSGLDWDVGAAAGELDWGAIGDSAVWNGADDSGNDNVDDRDARGDFGSFDDLLTYLFDPTTGRNDPVVVRAARVTEDAVNKQLNTRPTKMLLSVVCYRESRDHRGRRARQTLPVPAVVRCGCIAARSAD